MVATEYLKHVGRFYEQTVNIGRGFFSPLSRNMKPRLSEVLGNQLLLFLKPVQNPPTPSIMLYRPRHVIDINASPFKNVFRIIKLMHHVIKKNYSLFKQFKPIFFLSSVLRLKADGVGGKTKKEG